MIPEEFRFWPPGRGSCSGKTDPAGMLAGHSSRQSTSMIQNPPIAKSLANLLLIAVATGWGPLRLTGIQAGGQESGAEASPHSQPESQTPGGRMHFIPVFADLEVTGVRFDRSRIEPDSLPQWYGRIESLPGNYWYDLLTAGIACSQADFDELIAAVTPAIVEGGELSTIRVRVQTGDGIRLESVSPHAERIPRDQLLRLRPRDRNIEQNEGPAFVIGAATRNPREDKRGDRQERAIRASLSMERRPGLEPQALLPADETSTYASYGSWFFDKQGGGYWYNQDDYTLAIFRDRIQPHITAGTVTLVFYRLQPPDDPDPSAAPGNSGSADRQFSSPSAR